MTKENRKMTRRNVTTTRKQARKMSPAQRATREAQASMRVTDDGNRVEGKAVIARETAVWTAETNKIPNMIGKPVTTVNMLLLEDESVVYQCAHPHGGDCHYTRASLKSVFSHQRTHSPAVLLKAAQAELEMYREKAQRQFENRSNGARRAQMTRRTSTSSSTSHVNDHDDSVQKARKIITDVAKRRAAAAVVKVITDEQLPTLNQLKRPAEVKRSGGTELDGAARRVSIAYNAVVDATNELNVALVHYMRLSATFAAETAASVQVDPELVRKAEKWDQFVALRDD